MKGFPDLPPFWALGMAITAWLLARFLPLWRFDLAVPGQVFFWAGLGIIFWSAYWFWAKKTPIEPNHRPRALIVEGPYRLNRNPIYTGLVGVVLGYALGLGALSALLPVAFLPFILTARFIRREEAELRAAFGAEAERYMAATRRW
ncbi:MAG: methyltransferase [Pseudomonadota bacterium]